MASGLEDKTEGKTRYITKGTVVEPDDVAGEGETAIDGSPSDSTVPGILQARTLEWVAISFSNV